MSSLSPSSVFFWIGKGAINKRQKINEAMKNKLRDDLIINFPMRENHAEILINHYGYLTFTICLELYRQGFIFTDLDELTLEDVLNKNSKFRKAVDAILDSAETF